MTKVTLRESAVAEVKPAAPVKDTVTDSKGRVIKLRELDPLQQSRLTLAVGSEAAMNQAYMGAFVYPVAMVEYIDEDFYGFPASIAQIESMLKVLGSEGTAAVIKYLSEKAEAASAEAEKQAAKN